MESTRRKLFVAAALLFAVFASGTLGFYAFGGGEWPLLLCAYFVAITLATVGYGEVLPVQARPITMVYTIALMFLGMGVLAYFISTLTAFVVEGDLQELVRRRLMDKKIARLQGHVVVCGAGSVGRHVGRELAATAHTFVVVDRDAGALERLDQELGGALLHVQGDANSDAALKQAGVERASGLVAALGSDQENLFLTLSARQLNPRIRVVSKAVEPDTEQKLRLAGAASVVQVDAIGGLRIASEMIRPHVTDFLDGMLRDRERTLRVDEVPVAEGSRYAGARLGDTALCKRTDLLVLAVRDGAGSYHFNPRPDHQLVPGCTVIVMGDPSEVRTLR